MHIHGSMVTAELAESDGSALEGVIADLYTYYVPGVVIPPDEELIAMVEG